MELSNKYEYTLLALLELAISYPRGEYLQIRQIAEAQNIPIRYLEQLLLTLKHGGLIKSIRGSKGGYVLARDPLKITLLDAFYCIEGSTDAISESGTTATSGGRKVIEQLWHEANQAAYSVLQKYTVQDLFQLYENTQQQQTAPMYYI